ncbi:MULTISPECIES: hypothetical protein [unclassified Pseudomonas]|uniref:hypothetical protein n=1 Tax=unclassified Pseudomonas TaxID=196821 RepID=UPI001F577501|nr:MULTISPECIES: hypothetical protein [unclassified Pseudomonas]
MAVVKRNCIHCGATFDSKNSRGVYCSAACKSQHHRIRKVTERRVVVGRLEVIFRDVNPTTTQEMLEQMVHDALTPEILKIIHDNNEQPIQLGESHA